jgi:hypothetical protein
MDARKSNSMGGTLTLLGVAAALLTSACSPLNPNNSERALESFEDYVGKKTIGAGGDYWVQLLNSFDQWENVALVFGYYTGNGTYEECQHMIGGLKRANPGREYRCAPANLERS